MAALAARQYYVEYGGEVDEEGMVEVVENFIPPSWINRSHGSIKDWASSVVKYYNQLFDIEPKPTRDFVKAEMILVAKSKWYKVFSRLGSTHLFLKSEFSILNVYFITS